MSYVTNFGIVMSEEELKQEVDKAPEALLSQDSIQKRMDAALEDL